MTGLGIELSEVSLDMSVKGTVRSMMKKKRGRGWNKGKKESLNDRTQKLTEEGMLDAC